MATPTLERSVPNLDNGNDRGNKLKKVIAGIGIALAGAGIYTLSNNGPDVDKIAHETIQDKLAQQKGDVYNGDPIVITPEAPAGLTLENSSSADFYKYFSQEQRVEWANDQLNQPSTNPEHVGMTVLEAKWAELDEKFNLKDGPKFLVDLVPPSEHMSGDQILARLTVIANIISDEPSLDKQLKLLAAYVDPSNSDLYNSRALKLKNGNKLNLGTTAVAPSASGKLLESPVFTTADPGNGYRANGVPSRIMSVGDTEGNSAQDIIRFYNGVPVFYDIYDPNSPKNIPNPELIPAN